MGNTDFRTCLQTILCGSSPRVWGILGKAYAVVFQDAVHPHVCGEYSITRMWSLARRRFIPTCVGNTLSCASSPSCGGRFIPTCVGNTTVEIDLKPGTIGSSPRVWGIRPHPGIGCSETDGSSPRVWGIPGYTTSRITKWPVHPHVCGEYFIALPYHAKQRRFIPTCVGNTYVAHFLRGLFSGSSPRVWGILCFYSVVEYKQTVHPHVCGEYASLFIGRKSPSGSSPRVWGIRIHPRCRRLLLRFIPTCVGNTFLHDCNG